MKWGVDVGKGDKSVGLVYLDSPNGKVFIGEVSSFSIQESKMNVNEKAAKFGDTMVGIDADNAKKIAGHMSKASGGEPNKYGGKFGDPFGGKIYDASNSTLNHVGPVKKENWLSNAHLLTQLSLDVKKNITKQCYEIRIIQYKSNGSIAFAKPLELEVFNEQEAGMYSPAPTFNLSMEYAQKMMDEMWQAGIRPTSEEGNVGALTATVKHLEDMRKIAFDLLTLRA